MKTFLRYFCTLALLIATTSSWGTEVTKTYTFTSKDWKATCGGVSANWIGTKDGSQLTKNQGVQITTEQSGVVVTSPTEYSNISSIVVKYCTNASKGAGSLNIQVGSGTSKSFSVTKPSSGGTTLKDATFTFDPTESGSVKLTVNCTTNSIYINSISITYENAQSGPIDPYVSFSSNPFNIKVDQKGTNEIAKPSDLTVSYSSSNPAVAEVNALSGEVTGKSAGEATITASWGASGDYNAGSKSYAVQVTEPAPTLTYVKVERPEQILAGNSYILVCKESNVAMAGITGSNKYRNYETVQIVNNEVSFEEGTLVTLTLGGTNDAWTFKTSDDQGYLTNASSTSFTSPNTLATDDASYWSITSDFQVNNKKNTDRYIMYNASSPRFAAYQNEKKAYLYVLKGSPESISVPSISLASGTYLESKTVTLSCTTEDASIFYTINDDDPTPYSTPITLGEGVTTLKAYAQKDEERSSEVSATYNIYIPTGEGTETKPYTVADAIAVIDANAQTENEIYVTGIVSEIKYAFTEDNGISYNISDNGLTESDQLYAFKGVGSTDYPATDLQVEDKVIVKGQLTKYGSIYELAQGNQIVSFVHPVKPTHVATFSVNGTTTTEEFEEGKPITFPAKPADVEDKSFVGWTATTIDGSTDEAPTFVTSATMGSADVTYYAVFATAGTGMADASITITADTKNVPSSYGTAKTFIEYTLEGYKFQIQQMYKNNGKLQWRAAGHDNGTGTLYNSDALENIQSIVLNYDTSDSNKNFTVNIGSSENPTDGKSITPTVNGSTYTFDCSADNYDYFVLTNGTGAGYLTSLVINYKKEGTTYSGYCTTVLPSYIPAAPIVFHDAGEYEERLSVPMYAEAGATIYYTTDGSEPTAESTKYTTALTLTETKTVKAIAVLNGVSSPVVTKTFTITAPAAETANITAGYYQIKNNGAGKYINVAGRKTVNFKDAKAAETAPGTVLKVEAENGVVKVLRSQGVDLPGYAERAMKYVPKLVELAVDKLHAEGAGEILGENGLDAIMDKFNEAFDYQLHLEAAGENTYRIYGKTPSMKHVVDFYAENKANVDAKLPKLEAFINSAIDKVLEKTGGRGKSILVPFSLQTVWQNMGGNLTEPTDEASILKFYQEVLSSESNVWNFAYQTAMIYWNNVKNHDKYKENKDKLGEFAQYLDKVENIRPDFKYYIVANTAGTDVDFISEGNTDITSNAARTLWTVENRTEVTVNANEDFALYTGKNETDKEYYTAFYADFAYDLPEGATAYAIEEVVPFTVSGKPTDYNYAKRKAIEGTIPAQTPVLIASPNKEITLKLAEGGTAVTDNLLVGPEYLINEYKLKTAQVQSLFDLAKELLGESAYNNYVAEYEHLMLLNAGTVGNKYFFGLSQDNLQNVTDLRVLDLNMAGMDLGFYNKITAFPANTALLPNKVNPILLAVRGDVNRDGQITIADVTALVDIILGKADATPVKYDYQAARVNTTDNIITIADVTELVDIILGKKSISE